MKNKIEIGVMILTLLASTACGSSGGQSPAENSATDPSASPPSDPQNQASVADLSTSMVSIKNMSAIVGSYSQLSTDENNHLKGIAEASNKAWSNFEGVLSQIQSGKSVSVPTPELMDKYGVSNVTVDRKALDMWLKAFNDAQKKTSKGVLVPEKSVTDNGVIDISTMATTCNKVDDFSTLVEGINKTSGAACILALVDVVPGDEPAACGMFALNKMATKAATIMELSCKLLPLNPTVLKVYFGKPCLKTISDINPTADQTSVETRAIFKNNLDKAYVLKLLVDKGVKKVAESMKLALLPQKFIDTATGDLSKNISELLVTTGSAFGLNLDTPFDAINGDGPIDSKYIKWAISNPIIEIKDKVIQGESARGTTIITASLVNWPVVLKTEIKSLNIPYLVSAPPKLINFNAGPDVAQCTDQDWAKTNLVASFEIEDDDMDLYNVTIPYGSGYFYVGMPGDMFFVEQNAAVINGYVTMQAFSKTAGGVDISINMSDLCGNTVTANGHVGWLSGTSKFCSHNPDYVGVGLLFDDAAMRSSLYMCSTAEHRGDLHVEYCESQHGNQPTDECYKWSWDKLCIKY